MMPARNGIKQPYDLDKAVKILTTLPVLPTKISELSKLMHIFVLKEISAPKILFSGREQIKD